jgi:hypothetical protein
MKPIDWKSVVEIVGIGALIVGLYFVYEELRQTSTIARANMSLEITRITIDLNAQERDPAFANILVRARTIPEELTPAERVQLNAYYSDVIEAYIREGYNFSLGIFRNGLRRFAGQPRCTSAAVMAVHTGMYSGLSPTSRQSLSTRSIVAWRIWN